MRANLVISLNKILDWIRLHPSRVGVLAGWFQQGATACTALLVVPVLMRVLPPEEVGRWFSFQGFLAMAALVDLGLGFAISRQVAHCFGGNKKTEGSDFLDFGHGWKGIAVLRKTARRIVKISLILMVICGVIIFELILPHTKLVGEDQHNLWQVWYMMLGGALIFFSGIVEMSILNGLGKTYLTRIYTGMYFLLNGTLVIVAASNTHSLKVMAAMSLGCASFFRLLLEVVVRKVIIDLYKQDVPSSLSRKMVLPLFKVAVPVGIVNVGAFMVASVQVPLLGAILGPVMVAPFYLAQKIGQFLNTAATQLVMAQLPFFTRLLGGKKNIEARKMMVRVIWTNGGLVLLANLVFFFCSPHLAYFLAGKNVYVTHATLGVMALDYLILNSTVVFGLFVLASGKNPFVLTTLISGVLNITLIFLSARNYGIIAIPCAGLLTGLIINYWFNTYKGNQLLRSLR